MTIAELLRELRFSEGVEIRKHHDGVQIFVRGMPEGAEHRDGQNVDITLHPAMFKVANIEACDEAIAAQIHLALTDARTRRDR